MVSTEFGMRGRGLWRNKNGLCFRAPGNCFTVGGLSETRMTSSECSESPRRGNGWHRDPTWGRRDFAQGVQRTKAWQDRMLRSGRHFRMADWTWGQQVVSRFNGARSMRTIMKKDAFSVGHLEGFFQYYNN